MKNTAMDSLLCIVGTIVLAGVTVSSGARYCGTFSVAQHPVVVTKSKLHSNVKAGAPGARDRAVVLVDSSFSPDALADAGWRVISRIGKVATIEGDPATAPYLGAVQGILYVKKPGRIYPQLDSARKFTNVDQVHGTRPGGIGRQLTGKKVLIGIMDTEFDTRHPAFLDSSGAIRFVAIWNQRDTSHALPNRYGYGVIKNHAQIQGDSLFGLDGKLAHGTMSASLAAGSDKRYWKGPIENAYYGVAPDALLAGVMYSNNVEIIDGLDWLFALADSLKLPCVVNMSLGDHDGPHDGTSPVDQAIDNLSTAGHIVVGAAGNDGDKQAHIGFTVGRNETKGTWISPEPWGTKMYSGIELWGETGKTFTVTFLLLDTVSGKYLQSNKSYSTTATRQYQLDTVFWLDSTTQKRDTILFDVLTESSTRTPNRKPHCQAIMLSTNPVLFTGVSVTVAGTTGGTVHAWNIAKMSFKSFGVSGFFTGDSTYSMNELGGTAKRNITVGAYECKEKFLRWNGILKDWTVDTTKPRHSLTGYSSQGPTIDGRTKPDITAPGSNAITALPRGYSASSDDIAIWPDTTSDAGRYISVGGTSVAAPIVTGIVAMLLEADPTLTPEKVRQLLQQTAINDTATGVIGTNYNNRYGAGKVNALGAAAKLLGVSTVERLVVANRKTPSFAIVKLPGNRLQLFSRSKQPVAGTVMEAYSINGRCVAKYGVAKDGIMAGSFSVLSKGYYMVRAIRKDKTLCAAAITVVD